MLLNSETEQFQSQFNVSPFITTPPVPAFTEAKNEEKLEADLVYLSSFKDTFRNY